jgi:hypothetical protein
LNPAKQYKDDETPKSESIAAIEDAVKLTRINNEAGEATPAADYNTKPVTLTDLEKKFLKNLIADAIRERLSYVGELSLDDRCSVPQLSIIFLV